MEGARGLWRADGVAEHLLDGDAPQVGPLDVEGAFGRPHLDQRVGLAIARGLGVERAGVEPGRLQPGLELGRERGVARGRWRVAAGGGRLAAAHGSGQDGEGEAEGAHRA